MGLRKEETMTDLNADDSVIDAVMTRDDEQPDDANEAAGTPPETTTETAPDPAPESTSTELAPVVETRAPVVINNNAIGDLAEQGYEGLSLNWTSFPTISLKTEGHFEDFEGHNYGKEIFCRIVGTKTRWVYRGNPVTDNKKHVAFSYDQKMTDNGILIADILKEWRAEGKVPEEREYLETLVEMHDPEGPMDGEYRILSVSPTSKGRLSGYLVKARLAGKGRPGEVLTRVFVGPKVTKVANPFYPWHFEIVKG